MKPIRSACAATIAVLLLCGPVCAQIGLGGHMASARDAFGESRGVGLRLQVGLPLVPISVAVNGEYFFADCPSHDCSLSGTTFDLNYSIPIPFLEPFVGVGWSVRRVGMPERNWTERGPNVGGGLQFRLTGFRPFIDVRYEFADAPERHTMVRIGFMMR